MNIKEELSIVIPCYRSEKTIGKVVEEIIQVNGEVKEIILVNDGSPDNVWDEICRLNRKYRFIKGIDLSRNFGQHSALMAGYRAAKGNYIISMDDDGQSDPEGIGILCGKIEEGYDVVYAYYAVQKKSGFRMLGSFLNRKMSEWMIEKPKTIQGNSFFIMRGFVKDEIIRYEHSYPYIGGLVFRTTKNIGETEIVHRARSEGRSGYTLGKLIRLWMNGFTAFSILPLRIATYSGVICAVAGFILGIVFIVRKILNPAIILGYSSLIAVILFASGLMMMMMGMMGEYIGRIYINSNCSPQYVIRETTEEKILGHNEDKK